MTELGLLGIIQTEQYCTPGSVGGLNNGLWGKIIDPETGRNLGPNERGEMCFKGNVIMKGYYANPLATNSVIDDDGWLHTNDAGYYDENGEWYFIDRLQDMIKFKTYKISPVEIECLLMTHPFVIDAAVVGMPDEIYGELAFALVVRKFGENLNKMELLNFIEGIFY